MWYWKNNLSDLIQPNEKDEPHPPRKVLTGTWRIFCCQSVIDQMVERVLFYDVLLQIKRNYPHSGAVIGIGFSDELTTQFCQMIVETIDVNILNSSDIKGFEKSLGRDWIIQAARMVISKMKNHKKCTNVVNAMFIHAYKITNPLFVVPQYNHYALWRRTQPGGMLSGSYLTTLYNSLTRLDIAYVAGANHAWAAGDDCLETTDLSIDEIKSNYLQLGFVLRDFIRVKDRVIEFCSHEMSFVESEGIWKSSLTSWQKALFTNLSKLFTEERFAGFRHEVRNNENKIELIRTVGARRPIKQTPVAM